MSSPGRPPLAPLARPGIDRSADERTRPGLIDELRAASSTRVLVIAGDAAPLAAPDALLFVAPEDAPADASWAFLGRDAEGTGVLTAVVDRRETDPFFAPAGWAGLRAVGGTLAGSDAGTFVEALSLGRWLIDAPFCPACGTLTEARNAGWSRRCPACGREHFPRTDPAVILGVRSARRPDRLLLGSNALWEPNRYSCFAGFVEAGESLESTVVREVREEAGVEVTGVEYRGSQAWPYPRSLMLGFLATALDDEAARPDGEEILDVRWFTRDEIGAALGGGGDILLPGPASIAHRLIADWHADS